jgi:hypothetical protein
MGDLSPAEREWFEQADYDLDTAGSMFDTSRYI